jgi:predicted RNA-binding Zn-ribbon protein involved in translation (DUF1610 family)
MSFRDVAYLTDAFVDELINAVVNHGGFNVRGLGKLVVRIEKGTRISPEQTEDPVRVRLYFSKARSLKKLIADNYGLQKGIDMDKSSEGMTKYAVDEGIDPDVLEKAAAHGCPRCGAPVTQHGRVVECPRCGTEPFEK